MSKKSEDKISFDKQQWQHEQKAMALLSSLNYRTSELSSYLHNIACGISDLIKVDWPVVTLCQKGFEKVLASSMDMGDGEHVYSLHGSLTGTVIEMGQLLTVEDALKYPDYGEIPEGYCSYLGIPLRTAQGEIIGTICAFHQQPREFTKEEIQIAELFADRAATAIDHYHLYQQQCLFNQVLEAKVEQRTQELRVAQAKLVEQERLAAIGEFAAIIVHEIRNPLTTTIMGLKYSQKHLLSEASRLERLLSEILLYAKPQILQLCELDANEFINELLVTLCEMPEALSRQIQFIPASKAVKFLGDKDKMKQVFINIVRNACEAVSPGDVVKCEVDYSGVGQVCIHVCNGGEPIPPEILSLLTQPFFSTKSSGTGLGLAITKRIVNAHGGELLIQSEVVGATRVSVKLPVVSQ